MTLVTVAPSAPAASAAFALFALPLATLLEQRQLIPRRARLRAFCLPLFTAMALWRLGVRAPFPMSAVSLPIVGPASPATTAVTILGTMTGLAALGPWTLTALALRLAALAPLSLAIVSVVPAAPP